MTENLTNKVREYIAPRGGRDIDITALRRELKINPNSPAWEGIHTIAHRLVQEKLLKPSGRRDSIYRVMIKVEPVKWWTDKGNETPLDFKFPRCHTDGSSLGFEDIAEVFAGDMILIGGVSNSGKTAMALSILGENLGLFLPQSVLMGSEYTASDGKISPKFKRRMNRMDWAKWITPDGQPEFELLPIGSDYEDYIKADVLNIVDWISLPGEYYLIDSVLKSIKDRVGNGVVVAVIQKNRGSEFGEGGERSERYADVYLAIDPYGNKESMVTLGKVKSPKCRSAGRMWAFSITDYGANLYNIREIIKCTKCWGRGYIKSGQNGIRCDFCNGLKYINKG